MSPSSRFGLQRPRHGKVIAGVCAALADRFGISRTLVRIGFVLFGLFGVGELVYIVLWVIVPKQADGLGPTSTTRRRSR